MDNVNKGHRKRCRERIFEEGLHSCQDHEILEMLLFMFIRRRDTNKLAHTLIDKFGNIAGVLDAEPKKLMTVQGVSETTACNLCLIKEVMQRYRKDKAGDISLDGIGNIIRFSQMLLAESYVEKLVVAYVDSSASLIFREDFCSDSVNKVYVDVRRVLATATRCNAAGVILFHCHVDGVCAPSEDDYLFTEKLYFVLASMDVMLLEHIIFNRHGEFHSFHNERELHSIARKYISVMSREDI